MREFRSWQTQQIRRWMLLLLVVPVVLGAACGNDDDAESLRPESEAPPGDAPSSSDVDFVEAFPNLPGVDRPTGLVEVPGQDRFLFLQQDGQVFSFPNSEEASQFSVALDWREQTAYVGGEEGLLGAAFSPAFEDDNTIFLHYSAASGERRGVISRFEVAGSGDELQIDPDSEEVVIEIPQPAANHNGGQIAFGPDGMMYIAIGDGGAAGDPDGNAQDTSNLLGTILRIDVMSADPEEPYVIPDDNPFVGDDDAQDEIWAYGLRNPWRFSFDPENGNLWVADVGQAAWEEVNIVEPGRNYGWNIMEGFACYPEPGCDADGLELPVLDYENTGDDCSITGGYVARGETAGVLDGYYIYGDFCSGRVWAVPADASPASNPEPIELRSEGEPIPSFAQDLDGNIYVVSFGGPIYRIEGAVTGVFGGDQ